MKQTTMQFDKRAPQRVTIQRLQEALDLMSAGHKATHALQSKNLTTHWAVFFEKTLIIRRVNGRKIEVLKPIIERKDYNRLLKLRYNYEKKRKEQQKIISFYKQKKDSPFIDRPDTDMLGLVNMPKIESKRNYKPRVKKAVALPWWKRFLLYLLNH
jgi:hypothetical protein